MASDSHLLKVGDFVLNTDSRKLFNNQNREVLLSPTLYALLKYFIEHQNNVLTKEMIIGHVWKGKIVVEANVNQNIKKLRDVLGDSATTPKYIETVTGKGFRFIANSEEYKASPAESSSDIYPMVTYAFLLLTIIFALWLGLRENGEQLNSRLKEIHPITTLRGIEHYPSVSPDKKYLFFSHKEPRGGSERSPSWNVFVKPLDKESYHLLLGSENKEMFPVVSPDGQKLMYFEKGRSDGNEKCGLYSRAIDYQNLTLGSESLIKKCQSISERLRGEWLSDSEVFISINETLTSPASIYYYNIETQAQKLISRPDSRGFGDYVFKYSSDQNKLAYVRNIGWSSSEIWVFDLESETHQKVKSTPLNLRGVDWIENWLYFQSGSRAISRITDEGEDEQLVATTNSNLFVPFTIDDSRIGVVQGDMKIVDIRRIDLKSNSEEVIISSSFNDYFGVGANDKIAFVSNRSGDPQIWLKNEQGELSQLTKFESSFELVWLSIFPEKELIMFNKSGAVLIIDESGQVVFNSKNYSNQVHNNPVFDRVGNQILYSKQYNGEWTVESRELDSLGKSKMLFRGVTAKPCFNSSCILYFKEGDDYLYKYQPANNTSTKLIQVDFIRSVDQWEVLDEEHILFLKNQTGQNSITSINIKTGDEKKLLKTNVTAFSYDQEKRHIYSNKRSDGNTDIAYFNIGER